MIFIKSENEQIKVGKSNVVTFMEKLHQIKDSAEDDKIIIRCWALTDTLMRMVLHYDIDDLMMNAAVCKLRYVIKQFDT